MVSIERSLIGVTGADAHHLFSRLIQAVIHLVGEAEDQHAPDHDAEQTDDDGEDGAIP